MHRSSTPIAPTVIAERQPCIHENLERTLEHLVETGSLGRQRQVVGELGEGRTAPPFQGLVDEISGSSRIGREHRAGLVHPPFEPDGVDVVGVDDQHVATGSGLQRSWRIVAEIAPESRHVALHAC